MGKILVIDNDKDILSGVSFLLTINGFEVETEQRWEKTFDRIDAFNPDLILLDIKLDGGDGRTICKQIKEKPESGNIPVILFSAEYNVPDNSKGCVADDFIAKPFEIKELVGKIKTRIFPRAGR